MIIIVKRYCITSLGPANIGDVLEVEPNEHMVGVTVERLPSANLLTRGDDHARLIAHNLPFDHRKNAGADDFTCLYASSQGCPLELWSIEVSLGEKATLVLLTTDQAEQIFTALPKKLYLHTFLFDPERYKRQLEADRTANEDLKEAEKRKIEQAELDALDPFERMNRKPSLRGWD